MAAKEKKQTVIGQVELSEIANLLNKKQALAAELKEVDTRLKALVEPASLIYDKQTVETKNGHFVRFEVVRRIAPKYKEIAFELCDPAKIQALVDERPKDFTSNTVSYQAHFAKDINKEGE